MKPLTIGTVARLAGVGVETVRYYQRRGLIAEPSRRESGYRQYGPEAVRRIRFVRRAKELGFSLRQIKELLELQADPGTSCEGVKQRAEAKIVEIERKIRDLQEMNTVLRRLAAACGGRGTVTACPILEALDA